MAPSRKKVVIGGTLTLVVIAVVLALVFTLSKNGDDSPSATTPAPTVRPSTLSTPRPSTLSTSAPRTTLSPGTSTASPNLPNPPVVQVEEGSLQGRIAQVRGNEAFTYAAFLGIPYAAPPVGNLRFKGPKRHAPWTGVRQATTEGAACCQSPSYGFGGQEDCLFLNVYTPTLAAQELLPVYFFTHGGTFLGGSATPTEFGPDFLIQQNIVVVTIQYRLNSFGFVSLDSEEIPGNVGLKDMVAALQWVNRNIAQFSGDPTKVTVGGHSAGSALTSWLTILPETTGLMRSAILESGTAFHSWAYKEDHVQVALDLASRVAGHEITDIATAEQTLMQASAEDLTTATFQLVPVAMQTGPQLPFQPTPERRTAVPLGEPRLVLRDAESYFLNPVKEHVPYLMGVTNAEWRQYYYRLNPTGIAAADQSMLDNLQVHIPRNLIPFEDTRAYLDVPKTGADFDYSTVVEAAKVGVQNAVSPSCDLGCVMKEYIDDIWFKNDVHRLAVLRASKNERTFIYKFGVRTELNQPIPITPPPGEENVCFHGDDLYYSWHRNAFSFEQDYFGSSVSGITMRRIVTMWSNFIKYGNPIIEKNELLPVDWPPNTSTTNQLTVLNIETNLTVRQESLSGRMIPFWQSLYSSYRTK